MKLLCPCPVCGSDQPNIVAIHLRDDGAADVTCPTGHSFVAVSPHDKFEILFDCAALALIDEYPREAVTDFAAALEQFYAFFVRLVTETHIIQRGNEPPYEPATISPEETEKAWSQVAAQSERQLGAFLYLHLITTGKAYELDRKSIELRNKVVHRGYLPTLEEATLYGERAWSDITATLESMLDLGLLQSSPSEGEHRPYRFAKERPHVHLLELPHALMLYPSSDLGEFAERLFRLRTSWRRAVYGRGPRSDA